MKLLLDGHTLYWLIFDQSRLPLQVADALDDTGNDLFISLATLWELSAKTAKGRLPMPGNSLRYLLGQIDRIGIRILPVEIEDVLRTESLPQIHSDPFDRMIVAQALERGLTVLTIDRDIHLYPIMWLWS